MICLNLPSPFKNKEVYDTMRLWSLNGQTKDAFSKSVAGGWKYDIVYPGFKINLPDVLAAIALAQIKKYDACLLEARKKIFNIYNDFFKKFTWAICPVQKMKNGESSCHLYTLRIKDATEMQRDEIIQLISSEEVSVNVHFIPLPMLTIFKEMQYEINDYPAAYGQYANEISLPVYPQLTMEQTAQVCHAVKNAVEKVFGI